MPSVDLTESEQKVIAEYAAGLLLKYDKNYSGAIKSIEEDVEEDNGLQVIGEPETNEQINEDAPTDDNANVNGPEFSEELTAQEPGNQVEESIYSDMTIAEAIGLDGFDVIYKSYETYNIYPPEESDDLVFSLEAAPGMELLVLTFGITNNTPDRLLCDVLDSDTSFRLIINGSERVQGQKTMLLNDLCSYYEEVEGYGMAESVLVFEVAQGTSSTIDSLDLVIKSGNESTTHRLR